MHVARIELRGQGLREGLDATLLRIEEARVVAQRARVSADRARNNLFQIGQGHEAGTPSRGDFARGNAPQALVVRNHEVLRDAGAEMAQTVLLEVLGIGRARWPQLGLEHAEQAFLHHLGRQAVQVGLERVERGRAMGKNACLALDLNHLARQRFSHQLLHPRVAQMQPMAGAVETVAIPLARHRQPAKVRLFLE